MIMCIYRYIRTIWCKTVEGNFIFILSKMLSLSFSSSSDTTHVALYTFVFKSPTLIKLRNIHIYFQLIFLSMNVTGAQLIKILIANISLFNIYWILDVNSELKLSICANIIKLILNYVISKNNNKSFCRQLIYVFIAFLRILVSLFFLTRFWFVVFIS